MIKEITLKDGEKITIDFEGAPFWKLWALQLYCLVMVGKFMKEHKELTWTTAIKYKYS